MNVIDLCIHIVTCIFIIEIVCVLLDVAQNKKLYLGGGFRVCCDARGSCFLMKGAPPRVIGY